MSPNRPSTQPATTRTALPGGGLQYNYPDGGFDRYDSSGRKHAPENTPAWRTEQGTLAYIFHGALHRRNGPAMEHQDDDPFDSAVWYLEGYQADAATVIDAWLLEHQHHPTAVQRETLIQLCTPWVYGSTLETLYPAALAATI